MKMYCISQDIDTVVGLRLTGIQTAVVSEKEEVDSEIEQVLQDENIGILIVTKAIYEMAQSKLDEIRKNRKLPLIVRF